MLGRVTSTIITFLQTHTPDFLLIPGHWVFSNLGLSVDGSVSFIITAYISYCAYTIGLRFSYFLISKPLGLFSPNTYNRMLIKGWRWPYRIYEQFSIWKEHNFNRLKGHTGNTSSVLSVLSKPYKPGHILLGRSRILGIGCAQICGKTSDRHRMLIGTAGSGKTTAIVSEIALHKGTTLMLDVKDAELTKILHRRLHTGGGEVLGKGQRLAALDPFGKAKGYCKTAYFNFFTELQWFEHRFGKDAVVRFAAKIAEGLVVIKSQENEYFYTSARDFIMALILFIHKYIDADQRNPVTLRKFLTEGLIDEEDEEEDGFKALCEVMATTEAYDGIIAEKAISLAGGGQNSQKDVLATAREATVFLDFPEIRAICSKPSTFHLADLKEGNLNLSVIIPASDMQGALSGYVRCIVVIALYLFEQISGHMRYGCLYVLEEMIAMGNISAIAKAAPLLRSQGVRLLGLSQDLEGIQKTYPKSWRGLLGNSEALTFTGANDQSTAEYAERVMGKKTVDKTENGLTRERDYAVMTADQIKRYLANPNNILVITNGRPMLLKSVPYYRWLPVYMYDQPRDFKAPILKSLTRFLLRKLFNWLRSLKWPRRRSGTQHKTRLLPAHS